MSFYSKFLPTTPKVIKYLTLFTLAFGILSGFFQSALGLKLGISFISLFALSAKGLVSGFFWQPLTFFFVPQIEGALSFYFLFTLAFDVYLLWFISSKIYQLFNTKTTLKIFFIPSTIAALTSTLIGYIFNFNLPIFGLSFAMIPLFLAYSFSSPEKRFHFLPMQAFQAKWLGLGLIILYLFQDLSTLNFSSLLAHILTVVFSYYYLIFFQKLRSPFNFKSLFNQLFSSRKRTDHSSKVVYLYEEQVIKESKMDKVFNKMKKNEKLNVWDKIKLRYYRSKD